LPLSVACILIMDAILTLVLSKGSPTLTQKLTVITGKGLHSDKKDPVLQSKVPRFLREQFGIETTLDTKNTRRFFVDVDALLRFAQGLNVETLKLIYDDWTRDDLAVIYGIFKSTSHRVPESACSPVTPVQPNRFYLSQEALNVS